MTGFPFSPETETLLRGVLGLSAATDNPSVLRILFGNGPVTAEHRAAVLEAINVAIGHAQRPSTPFTEEMLLAGARAIFNAEIGAPDWHFPYWKDFKADCFRYARLVLEATSDSSTIGNSQ